MGGWFSSEAKVEYDPLEVKNDGLTDAEKRFLERKGFYDTNWQISTRECSNNEDCSTQAGDTRNLNGLLVGDKCPMGTSLSGFKMIRRRGKTQNYGYIKGRLPPEWAYRYKCSPNPEKLNCQIRTTNFSESSDYDYDDNKFTNKTTLGDLRFLRNHNIMCREGESLTNFKLEKSPDGGRIRYKYTCCETPTNNCAVMETPVYNHSQGDPHYLRRANVQCPENTVMTGKQLEDLGNNSYKYRFKCCVPITEVNCNKFWRKPDLWPAPNDQHQNICPLNPACEEGKTCGGTRNTPDKLCLKDIKTNKSNFINVGDIPKLDAASMQRAEDLLLKGGNTNYYQLCKYWLNNKNPSKTWQNQDPDAKKCTSFCQNYIVYNPDSFRGRQSRTEIEGFPLWKIKGLEES